VMVAYVLVAKYAWHLPLYRQAQMLLAQGIDIKRVVLVFWWAMRPQSFIRSGCGCARSS
jgi:transposase